VRRVVEAVLAGERRRASVSITFLGRDAMRRLNAEHKRHDEPTDVLTFAPGAGRRAWATSTSAPGARREARTGIPLREELVRLVVHGTLHALGRDHPEGLARTRSAMWRRQERYVEALA
jgi:probable rRNA maturation factor